MKRLITIIALCTFTIQVQAERPLPIPVLSGESQNKVIDYIERVKKTDAFQDTYTSTYDQHFNQLNGTIAIRTLAMDRCSDLIYTTDNQFINIFSIEEAARYIALHDACDDVLN